MTDTPTHSPLPWMFEEGMQTAWIVSAMGGSVVQITNVSDVDARLIRDSVNEAPAKDERIAELEAALKRVPDALNGAFSAGVEEYDDGSVKRQEYYMKDNQPLRDEIKRLLS